MKGRTLVIGLIVFILAVVAVIYFAMMAEFNREKPADTTVEIVD